MKNTDGPAFPSPHRMAGFQDGMTLRDWFAGRAMQEIIGFLPLMGLDEGKDQQVARRSYAIADAMLAERSKP